ncbi:hypothetical protein V6N13_146389 [Hibiscus sabdariffa]
MGGWKHGFWGFKALIIEAFDAMKDESDRKRVKRKGKSVWGLMIRCEPWMVSERRSEAENGRRRRDGIVVKYSEYFSKVWIEILMIFPV